jgi:hypothetical protein
MNGRNIPFVNHVKYRGAIFDKRLHVEMIEAMAFKTFIRIHSPFKRERLSANIKLTLHKALIRSRLGTSGRHLTVKTCSAYKTRWAPAGNKTSAIQLLARRYTDSQI